MHGENMASVHPISCVPISRIERSVEDLGRECQARSIYRLFLVVHPHEGNGSNGGTENQDYVRMVGELKRFQPSIIVQKIDPAAMKDGTSREIADILSANRTATARGAGVAFSSRFTQESDWRVLAGMLTQRRIQFLDTFLSPRDTPPRTPANSVARLSPQEAAEECRRRGAAELALAVMSNELNGEENRSWVGLRAARLKGELGARVPGLRVSCCACNPPEPSAYASVFQASSPSNRVLAASIALARAMDCRDLAQLLGERELGFLGVIDSD